MGCVADPTRNSGVGDRRHACASSRRSQLVQGGAEVAYGPFVLWYNLYPPGTMLMLLAIRPTNEVSIRVVSAVAFGVSMLLAVGMGLSITQSFDWMFFGYTMAALISAVLLARPMLCMCCCQYGGIAQPPRAALRQLWLGMRWFVFSLAAVSIVWPIRYGIRDEPNMFCALIYCINSFIVAGVLTPAVRGRAHRYLGNIGAKNTKEQEAACIAALIGGGAAAKALDEGGKRFRALPLSALTEADLSSSTDSGLHRKTKPATLGDVDGFISHSWQDDGAVKYARLHEWAKTDGVRNDGAEHPLIWLDKACINQDAIEASLRGLPVFLSGCRSLVVLAGPTYTSRLWYAAVAPRRARDASEAAPLRQVRRRALHVPAHGRRPRVDPRLPPLARLEARQDSRQVRRPQGQVLLLARSREAPRGRRGRVRRRAAVQQAGPPHPRRQRRGDLRRAADGRRRQRRFEQRAAAALGV